MRKQGLFITTSTILTLHTSIQTCTRIQRYKHPTIHTRAHTTIHSDPSSPGKTGEWVQSHGHHPDNTFVAGVKNIAMFAGQDGIVDALAINGDCSALTGNIPLVTTAFDSTMPSAHPNGSKTATTTAESKQHHSPRPTTKPDATHLLIYLVVAIVAVLAVLVIVGFVIGCVFCKKINAGWQRDSFASFRKDRSPSEEMYRKVSD